MNVKRGFLRLYVVLSGIWVLLALAQFGSGLWLRFEADQYWRVVPVACAEVASIEKNKFRSERDKSVCLVTESDFRNLFPQYNDIRSGDLRKRLDQKYGIKADDTFLEDGTVFRAEPVWSWPEAQSALLTAFAPVLVVGLLGLFVGWVVSGFKGRSSVT